MTTILFPLQMQRQYSGSLDPDLVFSTVAEKNSYLTSPRRYAGMVVTCVEEEGRIFLLNNTLDAWIEFFGSEGPQGVQGEPGISAYEVAVENGFVGTEADWLTSLIGPQGPQGIQGVQGEQGVQGGIGADGLSAYEVAVAEGFVGTEAEWLASLVGPQGPQGIQGVQGEPGPSGADGVDGAQGPQGVQGEPGPSGADGVDGAQGPQGVQGEPGSDGLSAYEVALANGFVGTESEWLTSLTGPQGPAGVDGPQGPAGVDGPQGPAGVDGPQGPAGDDGLSAYEIAVIGGYLGTLEEWQVGMTRAVESSLLLKGEGGPSAGIGVDGDSYINKTNGDFYEKQSGEWVIIGSVADRLIDQSTGVHYRLIVCDGILGMEQII